ncbi:MFS transporter [Paenibacillus sp. URB8-2]|uniref:MFS transporter n=1 Tax=Paenibacillus sp. URB8-2 TaxID=2741301 RepID=UPI0015C21781|nr:MFS transporter [Paenibacillus sp. URB8-2]BCG60684.1 hypothetical protein PUR_41090 [Paenibacillus sp. URB8-2]
MTALASSTIFTTYSVYYVAKLGFSPLQLMLIGTVLELTVLVFEGITGVVADTYGRRMSVIIGMFILGSGFTLEGSVVWLAGDTPLFSAFALVLVAQEGAAVVRRSPLLITIVCVTLFGGAASEGYDRLWQVHLINGIGFPGLPLPMAAWFGLISAASTLLGLLGVHFAERRIDMGSERKLSAVMLLLTAVRIACIAVLALSPSFGLALFSVLVIGSVSSVGEPVYASWLNRNLEGRTRATVLSMVSQSDALGQTAGGPVVGWIGSRFSIRASLLAASVLLLPLLAVFGRGTRRQL